MVSLRNEYTYCSVIRRFPLPIVFIHFYQEKLLTSIVYYSYLNHFKLYIDKCPWSYIYYFILFSQNILSLAV